MTNQVPTADTLEDTVERVSKFLRTVSRKPEILAVMRTAGYSQDVHQDGWRLYLAACNAPMQAPPPSEPSPIASQAIATLSRDDAPLLTIIDAGLRDDFPDQARFITHDLKDAEGASAVANVATILARIEELAKGREDSGAEDKAAVVALDTVRVNAARRGELATLVEQAQSWDAIALDTLPKSAAERFAEQQDKLVKLYRWYRKWADIAAVVIHRRDWLFWLGLATRKPAKKGDEPA